MTWQAYIDESEQDGIFVLAGYLSTSDKWGEFSAEWSPLARRFGRIDANGRWSLHMSEQRLDPDLLHYLPAFQEIIDKYTDLCFGISLDIRDFKAGVNRAVVINSNGERVKIKGPAIENHYTYAFSRMLSIFPKLISNYEEISGKSYNFGKVDFIFDERSEKNKILQLYEIQKNQFSSKNFLRSAPTFKDDADTPPLQAADFICYLICKCIKDYGIEKITDNTIAHTLTPWKSNPTIISLYKINSDGIFNFIKSQVLKNHPGLYVFDQK
ncbi:DUF3800 domain-containing protein [Sphingobium sp. AP49]|uniref:DUF3800 domain-containing protein n=1 Tax=Sphingobium sp. AP49 TaxID=1144307 RepID=UPI00026ED94C|nr:DUF3800 domain-containing protein [Sphingobium sp. AP49]WHO37576.1 DUF3800 domain-containing protein [Sphingobium sp. AP49]